jgi:uncharacterized protein
VCPCLSQRLAPVADPLFSADETAALRASVQAVSQAVAAALAQAHNADRAVQVVRLLHRGADRVFHTATATATAANGAAATPLPAIACQVGCAHCCRLRVEATQPEVLALAQHLRGGPADVLTAAVQRLTDHVAAQKTAPPAAGTATADRVCALLVNQRCSAYSVRPAACRKAHSLDASACETRAAVVPQNMQVTLDVSVLMAGTQAGYRQAGLASDTLELNAALLAALQDPTAAQRWFADRL